MSNARTPPLRTFFALWPNPEVRDKLARRAAMVAKAVAGRPVRPELLHLTLVFIGATPREGVPALQTLMAAIRLPRFVLQFDHCGWWRHHGIAWAGTQHAPEELLALQRELARGAERLGFSLDVRPYVAHLTMARDAGRSPPAAMPPLAWGIDSFALVASDLTPDGPRYRILHECSLDQEVAVSAPS